MSAASGSFVHRAVLFGDDTEAAAVIVTQLLAAQGRGDPAVVVLAPAVRRAVQHLLGASAGRVHFRDLHDIHARSVEDMIANYLRIVDGLWQGGRVSTIVQYDPDHPHDGSHDFCYRVEAAVNIAAAQRPVDNTCMYDLRAVSGDDVAAARRTHPRLVVAGVEGPNPDLHDLPVPTFVITGPGSLPGLRAWVREHAAGVQTRIVDDLTFAASEAATSVVQTGAGAWVDLHSGTDRITLQFSWTGRLPMLDAGALRGEMDENDPLYGLNIAVRVAAPGTSVRTKETPHGPVLDIVVAW